MPRYSVRKSISRPFRPLARALSLPKPERGISSNSIHILAAQSMLESLYPLESLYSLPQPQPCPDCAAKEGDRRIRRRLQSTPLHENENENENENEKQQIMATSRLSTIIESSDEAEQPSTSTSELPHRTAYISTPYPLSIPSSSSSSSQKQPTLPQVAEEDQDWQLLTLRVRKADPSPLSQPLVPSHKRKPASDGKPLKHHSAFSFPHLTLLSSYSAPSLWTNWSPQARRQQANDPHDPHNVPHPSADVSVALNSNMQLPRSPTAVEIWSSQTRLAIAEATSDFDDKPLNGADDSGVGWMEAVEEKAAAAAVAEDQERTPKAVRRQVSSSAAAAAAEEQRPPLPSLHLLPAPPSRRSKRHVTFSAYTYTAAETHARTPLQLLPRDLNTDLAVKPWMVALPQRVLADIGVGVRDWDRER
ncbi:MAG: hypothetical protein CYPHOPRED_005156 [Cyphobasidiales sp. Tagirdzhanova-0007]|nr:MAG: hypothetical protein CYPHOPRED_005156 [Cyphobasidiales sp. Tagirdzhanova-0007]